MKLTGSRIDAFLRAPDLSAVLVYGPDHGLIRERLDLLARRVVAELTDPFRLVDLTQASLTEEPSRLSDEMAALSMIGGRRVVRLRNAGDWACAPLETWLARPVGDALLLIEGGDLSPRSALRKLAETNPHLAALPCYGDEGGTLSAVIQDSLRKHQLTADPEVAAWLADNLGGDRLVTRAEIEKLALYMGQKRRVTLEDAMAVTGDSAALSQDDLAMAVAEGAQDQAQRIYDRLLSEQGNAISVLRGLQRHFARLHQAAGAVREGKNPEQALAGLRPPPHFKAAPRMKQQLSRWTADRLSAAMELLLSAEIDCKTGGAPAEQLAGRAILQLTRAARR